MSEGTLLDQLMQLEEAGWSSLCDGTGGEFYGQLMTDDALMVMANGQVMTRDQVVDALSQAPPWASFHLRDPQVVHTGTDGAALVYTGTASRDGADDFVGAMTSAYRRVGDSWRLALYQQTAVADA